LPLLHYFIYWLLQQLVLSYISRDEVALVGIDSPFLPSDAMSLYYTG